MLEYFTINGGVSISVEDDLLKIASTGCKYAIFPIENVWDMVKKYLAEKNNTYNNVKLGIRRRSYEAVAATLSTHEYIAQLPKRYATSINDISHEEQFYAYLEMSERVLEREIRQDPTYYVLKPVAGHWTIYKIHQDN